MVCLYDKYSHYDWKVFVFCRLGLSCWDSCHRSGLALGARSCSRRQAPPEAALEQTRLGPVEDAILSVYTKESRSELMLPQSSKEYASGRPDWLSPP